MKNEELDKVVTKLGLEILHRIHEETVNLDIDVPSKFEYVLNNLINKIKCLN